MPTLVNFQTRVLFYKDRVSGWYWGGIRAECHPPGFQTLLLSSSAFFSFFFFATQNAPMYRKRSIYTFTGYRQHTTLIGSWFEAPQVNPKGVNAGNLI